MNIYTLRIYKNILRAKRHKNRKYIIHNIILLLHVKNKANIYLNSIFFMCIKMLFYKSIVTIYNLTIQLLCLTIIKHNKIMPIDGDLF